MQLLAHHYVSGDLNSDPSEPVHTLLEYSGVICSYSSAVGYHSKYTTCRIRYDNSFDETLHSLLAKLVYILDIKLHSSTH
ncbi:hypothetical protein EB796_000728 [Bugula neritina]|uniref:Uncharacterized protein n=1 Tax=Bugula neritina TaxID=10212 RepID=A0A7J7KS39_BUGNE|nr:hypothetical protein EB796_000728 [Bugula neritina]